MNGDIVSEAAEQMATLPYNLQERALNFIKELNLSGRNGISGRNLLKYAGFIPSADLKIMSEIIDKDCGKPDINEW